MQKIAANGAFAGFEYSWDFLKISGFRKNLLRISGFPKNFLRISGFFFGFPSKVYGISEVKCPSASSIYVPFQPPRFTKQTNLKISKEALLCFRNCANRHYGIKVNSLDLGSDSQSSVVYLLEKKKPQILRYQIRSRGLTMKVLNTGSKSEESDEKGLEPRKYN